jgi:hypothetical protein
MIVNAGLLYFYTYKNYDPVAQIAYWCGKQEASTQHTLLQLTYEGC